MESFQGPAGGMSRHGSFQGPAGGDYAGAARLADSDAFGGRPSLDRSDSSLIALNAALAMRATGGISNGVNGVGNGVNSGVACTHSAIGISRTHSAAVNRQNTLTTLLPKGDTQMFDQIPHQPQPDPNVVLEDWNLHPTPQHATGQSWHRLPSVAINPPSAHTPQSPSAHTPQSPVLNTGDAHSEHSKFLPCNTSQGASDGTRPKSKAAVAALAAAAASAAAAAAAAEAAAAAAAAQAVALAAEAALAEAEEEADRAAQLEEAQKSETDSHQCLDVSASNTAATWGGGEVGYVSQNAILEMMTMRSIDRPLEYRTYSISREQHTDGGFRPLDLVPDMLKIMWENQGVSAQKAVQIFHLVPIRLQEILREGLSAAGLLLKLAAHNTFCEGDDCSGVGSKRKRIGEGGVGGDDADYGRRSPKRQAVDLDPPAASTWSNSGRCGFQRIDTDVGTNMWKTCAANDFISKFAGLHREEFLSRMANHDMGLASTELRQLCAHVGAVLLTCRSVAESHNHHPLSMSDDQKLYFYSRWTKDYGRGAKGEGVLMRSCFTPKVDAQSRLVRCVTRTQVVVSEEEYDRVRVKEPLACEVLATAVVGAKSAAQLVSAQILEDECIANMVSSEQGRTQLDVLAAILEEKFTPIIQLAKDFVNQSDPEKSSESMRSFKDFPLGTGLPPSPSGNLTNDDGCTSGVRSPDSPISRSDSLGSRAGSSISSSSSLSLAANYAPTLSNVQRDTMGI